jgi:hypothetical protein
MTSITEKPVENGVRHGSIVRGVAHVISFIFHPIFVPVYITLFVLYVHPMLFAGYTDLMKVRMVAMIVVNLSLLPAATVFLCWRLKFIDSMVMNTQKERIIPLAAAMIFYFWCWYVLKSNTGVPDEFRNFLLGCFITIISGWMANIAFKVSLHGLAAGGLIGFLFLLTFYTEGGSAQYFALAVIIAGAVCTSRLLLGTHRAGEVYAGFFIGLTCQLAASLM